MNDTTQTPTDQPDELTYEKALDDYAERHGKGWTGLFNCPCAECRKAVALLAPHKKTEPSELDAIRARVDEIEHLHTRADLHLISEILKAAGYTCEIRDDEEWWSNGGVWSSQSDAYGMLQFEDMLEVAKLSRRLLELLDERKIEMAELEKRVFLSLMEKDSEIESLRRELAEYEKKFEFVKAELLGDANFGELVSVLWDKPAVESAMKISSLERELAEARELLTRISKADIIDLETIQPEVDEFLKQPNQKDTQ